MDSIFGQKVNSLHRTGRDSRINVDSKGRASIITRQRASRFIGYFPVTLAGQAVAVGEGTVQSLSPTITGVRLDGTDASGSSGLSVPLLDIGDGPDSDFRSWVVLHTMTNLKTGNLDPNNEKVAVIEHRQDYPSLLTNGVCVDDGNGNGYFALAMIVWQSDTVPLRVVQNTYFNLGYIFKAGPTGSKGWHIYTSLGGGA